ncbi:hypothetical protein AGMMS49944_05340 [Spirochaetia bacterium]|nr:hypothetical protein AGMMS49944_05340 [Spirochaetia bacterium]
MESEKGKDNMALEFPGLVKRGKTMKTGIVSASTASAPEVDTVALLLRCTEQNAHTIAALFPGESADFIQGYIAGHIDALRLALVHVKDEAARKSPETPLPLAV